MKWFCQTLRELPSGGWGGGAKLHTIEPHWCNMSRENNSPRPKCPGLFPQPPGGRCAPWVAAVWSGESEEQGL